MPFKPGKSPKDATNEVKKALNESAVKQVEIYLGKFLEPEEMKKIEVKISENHKPIVEGDEEVLEKIKRYQQSS